MKSQFLVLLLNLLILFSVYTINMQCAEPCQTCANSPSQCLSCPDGYALYEGACLRSHCRVSFCQECSKDGLNCIRCNQTFKLNSNRCSCPVNKILSESQSADAICIDIYSTLPIKISQATCSPGCNVGCQANNFCPACSAGYKSNGAGGCVNCLISNCASCFVNNFCSACATGLSVSTRGFECIVCSGNNSIGCIICSQENRCAACLNSYTSTGTLCLKCFVNNCIKCDNNQSCSVCSKGYFLSSSICTLSTCNFPSSLCQNGTITTQCVHPYFGGQPTINGKCLVCNDPHCFDCKEDATICNRCDNSNGFVLTNNTVCVFNSTLKGCGSITLQNPQSKCESCLKRYAFNNGQCFLCNAGSVCLNCNPVTLTQCTQCMTGYYLKTGSCIPCLSSCINCIDGSSCISKYNSDGKVVIQSKLFYCTNNCNKCINLNPSFCTDCNNGFYYANNGVCLPCTQTSNCKSCDPASPATCLTCFSLQVLSNNTCINCQLPCVTCNGITNTSCTSCPFAYFLSGGSCSACKSNCKYCSNSSVCEGCQSGFFLAQSGDCVICSKNCGFCRANKPAICLQCPTGFWLTQTFTCQTCAAGCQTCIVKNTCTKCYANYYLTQSLSMPCAPKCSIQCATCSYTDSNFCTSCIAGYTLNQGSGKCQNDIACSDIFNCFFCPLSTSLNSIQQCRSCSSNCNTCSSTSSSECTSCVSGFYQKTGNCIACDQSCQNCTNANYCTMCNNGYFYKTNYLIMNSQNQFMNNQQFNCLACSQTCLTCMGSSYYCLSCGSGYLLYRSTCLKLFNFQFNLYFEANMTIFLQNYQAFVKNMTATANVSQMQMFITTTEEITNLNSNQTFTYVSGYISSPDVQGSATSESSYANLLNNLKGVTNNGTLANMGLNSYSLLINGGNPSTTAIKECSPTCSICNSSSNFCTACATSFSLVFNAFCAATSCNVVYCQECQAGITSICVRCITTFILLNNRCVCQTNFVASVTGSNNATCVCQNRQALANSSECIQCKVGNCLTCSQSQKCKQCVSEFVINNLGLCVICNIQDCDNCERNNFCTSCRNNLTISSSGDTCLNCTANQCAICNNDGSCDACNQGSYFDSNKINCISCKVSNCVFCDADSHCSQCAPGYSLNNGLCAINDCKFPCLTCVNQTCNTCVSPPYNPTPNTNNQCISCNISNCKTCNSNNTAQCIQCISGFINNSNSQCSPQCKDLSCNVCNVNNNEECTGCLSGYIVVSQGCVKCGSGCNFCNSSDTNQCLSCMDGYYMKDTSCLACPSYCALCTSAIICSSLRITTGQTLITINNVQYLAKCAQGCVDCSENSPSNCIICQNGFYLTDGVCLPCGKTSHCRSCTSMDSTSCLTCFPNNFIIQVNNTSICNHCNFPCISCKSQSQLQLCTTCPPNYLLQNDTCIEGGCPADCKTCSDSTTCTECYLGHTVNSGNCLPCQRGCDYCSSQSPGICLSCADGTYLNTFSSVSQCVACSDNCQSCIPARCTACFSGFYLVNNMYCGIQCDSPCSTCAIDNPTSCLTCVAGYSLDSNSVCLDDISCSQTFDCSICPAGYSLNNINQCIKCQTGCAKCNVTSVETCTSCIKTFYLKTDNTCAPCPTGCSSCLTLDNCLSCAFGYTAINKNTAIFNSNLTCTQCITPCQTCDLSISICSTCVSGFSMVGTECVSDFNFQFSVKLETTFITFYLKYLDFILVITNTGGSVSISSVTSGSVVVGGSINSAGDPSSNAASTQFTQLNSILSQNSQIVGFNIQQSSITQTGGSIPSSSNDNDDSSDNTVLIVAIVVPICVILIIVIIVICYCKKKKENSLHQDILDSSTGRNTIQIELDKK